MALIVTVTLVNDVTHEEISVINPDRVRWDMTAHKQKWPSFQDAPFLGTTFLAWSALRRLDLYSENFETFQNKDCLEVDIVEDEESEAEGIGNPT